MSHAHAPYGIAVAVVLVGCGWWFLSQQTIKPLNPRDAAGNLTIAQGATAVDKDGFPVGIDPALKELFLKMKKWPRPSLAAEYSLRLSNAIASGLAKEYIPAFYALFGSDLPRDEVARILKKHLTSSNLGVRYMAAEMLMKLGEKSAVPVLLQILTDPSAKEFQPRAAGVLAKYRVKEAGPLIANLYMTTKSPGFAESAYRLGMIQVVPTVLEVVNKTGFFPADAYAMAYLRSSALTPLLDKMVNNPDKNIRDKAAATWSMYRLTDNATYLTKLLENATAFQEVRIEGAQGVDANLYWGLQDAFRYSAGEKKPEVRQLMESALTASNKEAAAVATVSLILVQGGSAQAEDALIAGVQNRRFDRALLLNVASAKPGRVRDYVLSQADVFEPAELDKYFNPQLPKPVETWIYEFIPTWDLLAK
jgi:HEAT repeat protein